MALLTSVLITPDAPPWTEGRKLDALAATLGVAFATGQHWCSTAGCGQHHPLRLTVDAQAACPAARFVVRSAARSV
jgi:hypothetical protein